MKFHNIITALGVISLSAVTLLMGVSPAQAADSCQTVRIKEIRDVTVFETKEETLSYPIVSASGEQTLQDYDGDDSREEDWFILMGDLNAFSQEDLLLNEEVILVEMTAETSERLNDEGPYTIVNATAVEPIEADDGPTCGPDNPGLPLWFVLDTLAYDFVD